MLFISHRGNTTGPNPELENNPEYIMKALDKGYQVEIDLWVEDGRFYLGHDKPQYEIDEEFLKEKYLWIHCKNYEALKELLFSHLNYFYHTDEDYVLTSKHYIWAYPGKPGDYRTICVLPELEDDISKYFGVCSDYVENYI